MDNRTPREKLLQASGIKKPADEKEELLKLRNEMVGRIDAMVHRVEQADSGAQETRRLMEQMLERLENFCDKRLPAHMTKVIEAMAQKDLSCALEPLQQGVQNAAQRIYECDRELTSISWNWRLLAGPLIVGLFTALLAAGMVRCTQRDTLDDAVHYELLGRNVEKRILQLDNEGQHKMYDWINGVPQPEPKKASRKRR